MIELRRTRPEELRTVVGTIFTALLNAPPTDEDFERSARSYDDMDSVSAWDGDRCVGHVGAFRFDTIVPGGAWLATSGVTRVGVLPTHRRQGLLTGMMTELVTAARAEGRVLASLRASEAVIYGRFGFGLAGEAAEVRLDVAAARPIIGAAPGTIRLLDMKEILDVVPPIYERVARRSGVIGRARWVWERYLRDALDEGGDAGFVAVHTDLDGIDDGFAHYTTAWKEGPGLIPTGEGQIHDVWGATPAAELAIWRYLSEIDLITTWRAEARPVDDLVRRAIADPRAYVIELGYDEQWLRLLDVDRALAARGYADAVQAITIAVRDPMFDDNGGVWRVAADGARRIGPADGDAELVAGIAELSAAYLGGTPWQTLADVGLVEERRPGAAADADALFAVHPAPFCGSHF